MKPDHPKKIICWNALLIIGFIALSVLIKVGANYIYRETYAPRKLHGLFREFYDDGSLKKTWDYIDGKRHGVTRVFYPNGNIESEWNYADDKLNGISKVFYENGSLKKTWDYIDGKRHGVTRVFYPNGNIESEWNYADDKLDGISKTFYENGQLKYEISWKDHLRHGPVFYYNRNGVLLEETDYEEGIKVKIIAHDVPDGEPAAGAAQNGSSAGRAEISASFPAEFEALRQLHSLFDDGLYEDVILIAGQILEEKPDFYTACVFMARALVALGQTKEALQLLADIADSSPSDTGILLALGEIHYSLDSDDDAIGVLKQAYQMSPGNPAIRDLLAKAYDRRALWYYKSREYRKVIEVLEARIKIDHDPWAWNLLLESYGSVSDNFRWWRLQVDIRNWIYRKDLGHRYRRVQGRWLDLEDEIDSVREKLLEKPAWEGFGWLGWLYVQQGDFFEAARYLTFASQSPQAGKQRWIAPHLAAAHTILGDHESARASFPEAMSQSALYFMTRAAVLMGYFTVPVVILLIGCFFWRRLPRNRQRTLFKPRDSGIKTCISSWYLLGGIVLAITGPVLLFEQIKIRLIAEYVLMNVGHASEEGMPLLFLIYGLLFAGLTVIIILFRGRGTWFRHIHDIRRLLNKSTWLWGMGAILAMVGVSGLFFKAWEFLIGGIPRSNPFGVQVDLTANPFLLAGLFFIGIIYGPIVEELYFRGFLQTTIRQASGPKFAVVMSSVFFTFAHERPDLWIFYFMSGLVFGWLREKHGHLGPCMATHILLNLLALAV